MLFVGSNNQKSQTFQAIVQPGPPVNEHSSKPAWERERERQKLSQIFIQIDGRENFNVPMFQLDADLSDLWETVIFISNKSQQLAVRMWFVQEVFHCVPTSSKDD